MKYDYNELVILVKELREKGMNTNDSLLKAFELLYFD